VTNQDVKKFYDNEGWQYLGDNSRDAIINENLTKVAASYVSNVRLRILDNLGSGDALLDVGCGPIQYPEYVSYSQNFKLRVCVDLSEEALKLAKNKIGKHGVFIVGDYLHLEASKEAPFAGATLINVLYHIEKNKQEELVRKILADLRPGANLVIVYSNPRTLSAIVTKFLVAIKHKFIEGVRRKNIETLENPIYFFRHPISFWDNFRNEAFVTTSAWRTFSPALERLLFREHLFGAHFLRVLFRLEKCKFWGLISEYTLIVLKKR
jgi:SAM-dependent methyltransferase